MNLLIEESTTEKVPKLLEDIINKIYESNEQDVLQKDLLFMLIIVLMVENRMMLVKNNVEIIDPMVSMDPIDIEQLSHWKSHLGSYEALFIMCGFKNILVRIVMSPLGGISIVNAVISILNSETYTICLPMSRYVVSPLAKSIPMKFRDLKHFSTIFKNKIISPVKSCILSFYGYASASLIGLPEEILYKIMLFIPIKDVLSTCSTCTRMKYLLDNETLWHNLFIRDFNSIVQNDKTVWKDLYKVSYIAKEEDRLRNRARTSGTMHDYMDYSDYVSYIDNPMWSMMV